MATRFPARFPYRLLFLLTASCVFANNSLACFVAPAHQLVTPDEILAKSRDVTLARVIAAEPAANSEVRFTFEVIQRFSGQKQSTFEITGYVSNDRHPDQTFDDHRDPFFGRPVAALAPG
jgi:hypothetical protein